ncbi:MAG: type II/IV secretion system protein [Desulfobacteraceae bacterium]|nr:type II/IV secretion system protein [Desulfobacteraceae bacterium]
MSSHPSFLDLLISEQILTREDSIKLTASYGDQFVILKHLLDGKVASKEFLGKLWGDSIGIAYVNLDRTLFQSKAVDMLTENFARKNQIIPLYLIDGVVTVAAAFPNDRKVLDVAAQIMECKVSSVFSFPEEIINAIDIQYQSEDSINEFIGRIADNALFKGTSRITVEQMKKIAGDQSVVEFCRSLLLLAVKEKASDIHIDPQERVVYVRYRIDGVLKDRLKLEKAMLLPLVSRLKILAKLDITERRRPQDGRVNLSLSNKTLDFRLSTVPTIYGEKVVLRALGNMQQDEVLKLNELNLSKKNYQLLKKIITVPNGVFFVTGPTGSGKTTTLFSVLQYLNTPDINIMTVEDPVEYRLSRVNQVQINKSIDFDFSMVLRSFLRQDPDVILIGEIRDLETAKIAAQAALTGHLVLATMHTNSALQAVTRLVEIGVEPFLVAPSIIGVMAQRLVRQICSYCKERYKLGSDEIEQYFIWDKKTDVYFYRGKGCPECNGLGYLGRLAIHELFILTDEVRSLIAKKASILDIEKTSKELGFMTMRHDGMKKVLMGQTTIEELERVTANDQ